MNKKEVLDKFILDLVEELKRENVDREYKEEKMLDIAYIVAPLKQDLLNDKYKDFISNLTEGDYQINYNKDMTEGYTNGNIDIDIYVEDYDDGYNYQHIKDTYKIEFGKDERYWGYCECEPEDEGYREDKNCCGHGCNWVAPTFSVEKILSLGSSGWAGDEHSFWDFEDSFLITDKDLAEEKARNDKELKIKTLKNNINSMQAELDLLLK